MFSRLFGIKKRSLSGASPPSSPTLGPKQELPKVVTSWTSQHVVAWLAMHDMKEYASTFVNNAITGAELVELTEKDLETLGIKKLGARKKIIKFLLKHSKSLNPNSSPMVDDESLGSEASNVHSSSLSSTATAYDQQFEMVKVSADKAVNEQYALFEDLPDGVIVIGADKSIQFVNKSAERTFLFARNDLVGCNVNVIMSEPHKSKHDVYIDRYLSGNSKGNIIGKGRMVEGKAKDNSLVPIWLSITESIDENNKMVFIGTFKDLRSINPSSKSTANKMLSLLDNLVDSAIVTNIDSEIIFFNKSAESFFGYSRDEVLTKGVEMLMPQEYATNHKQYVQSYLKTKQAKVIGKGRNVTVLKKNGEKHEVFFSLTETKWGENNSIAFCATLHPLNILVDAKKNAQLTPKKSQIIDEKALDLNEPTTVLLHEIMDIPRARAVFKQYLEQVHNVEPFLFIEAVDEFKMKKSNMYRYKCAIEIYETFIKNCAPRELNLSSSIKQPLLSLFVEKKIGTADCPSNIFDKAQNVITFELKMDCFQRFLQSDEFKTLAATEPFSIKL